MTIHSEISWKGVDELMHQFDVSSANADKYTKEAMNGVVARAQRTAKSLSRVRTGYMRNNINVMPVTGSGKNITGTLIAEAEYSSFNEYGTYKMSAKPFMRPAATDATPYFYKEVEAALKRAGAMK